MFDSYICHSTFNAKTLKRIINRNAQLLEEETILARGENNGVDNMSDEAMDEYMCKLEGYLDEKIAMIGVLQEKMQEYEEAKAGA